MAEWQLTKVTYKGGKEKKDIPGAISTTQIPCWLREITAAPKSTPLSHSASAPAPAPISTSRGSPTGAIPNAAAVLRDATTPGSDDKGQTT